MEEPEILDESTDIADDASSADLEPSEPQWNVSRDEWEATQSYLQQTAPIMEQIAQQMHYQQMQAQQAQQQQMQPQLPSDFDPFDPQSVQAYINAHVQAGVQTGVQGALAPWEGMLATVAQSQGEQEARAAMEAIQGELGDFDRDTAFMFASGLIDQVGDPTQALRFGAQQAKQFEDRIRADERERYKQEMQELSSAPQQTPVGGSTADVMDRVPTGRDRYEEVAERWLARQGSTNPFG